MNERPLVDNGDCKLLWTSERLYQSVIPPKEQFLAIHGGIQMNTMLQFLSDDQGQDLIECTLVLAFVA